jgi:peptide/nickel transport system permease protein
MREIISRLGRFTLVRAVFLICAIIIAVYITVIVANMGGELDKIRTSEIREQVAMQVYMNPSYRGLPPDQLQKLVDGLVQTQIKRLGMDQPFFPKRSFQYLWRALTLQLGWAEQMSSDAGSRQVRLIILERLPTTLLLFGTANLFLFFASLFVALFLSRRYGSFLDKATIGLAPSSAAPGWFYGLFLIMIFAAQLRWLPWGGLVDAPIPQTTLGFAASVLRHTILPATAVVLSSLFVNIYSWRTFFLIYSSEDYVELARAKGLSSRGIEMRYVLRPTLPPIITNFLLVLITMWMGQIVLETVFQWPGLGRAFYVAIQMTDTPVIIGITVIFGYLLAVTVFALDFIYAVVDPRVRIGAGERRT